MSYRIGIDIGGTFTDFAVLKDSQLILHKNLSTPADRSVGVMTGLRHMAARICSSAISWVSAPPSCTRRRLPTTP
jgi:N-methylhydantoinase A/oxoprolinase/acetone carboxylase beta subunit